MSEPSRFIVRVGGSVSVILLFVVILRTQSRGAFLGLVAAMLPTFLLMLVKRTRMALCVTVVVALTIYFAISANVWDRLGGIAKLTNVETIAEADREGSAAQRAEVLKVGWRIFCDHPLFGVGLGAYPRANAMYAPYLGRKDAHNTYLSLAAEVGLPGMLLWCALLWSVLRYAYRSRREIGVLRLATQQVWIERAFVGYLVAGLFGTYHAVIFPYLLLAVLWSSANLLVTAPSQNIEKQKSPLLEKQ
jgi:O-antigen ligase